MPIIAYGDVVEAKTKVVIEKHLSGGDLAAVKTCSNNLDWWILVTRPCE
jgi:hypothetical protein